MKKVLYKIIAFCLILTACIGGFAFPKISTWAAGTDENQDVVEEVKPSFNASEKMNTYLSEFVTFKSRIAGSENEKDAANYIFAKLNGISGLQPVKSRNENDLDGFQSFMFTSQIDGKQHFSQNVIFSINASKKTDKKIIIGCSYDALAFNEKNEVIDSEAVNGSAGSVAVTLALAEYLSLANLEYNVEFIFFGAGTSNNAGSEFYTNGISSKDSENILLALNIDTVSLGKNLYFYVDEVKTSFSNFVSDLSSKNKLNTKEIKTSNLGKILLEEPNEIGLTYTHIALDSNNLKFMKLGILSMNVFAGDYSSGVVIGRSEYEGKKVVTFTKDDNLEFESKNFGENEVINNLTRCFDFVAETVTDAGFVSACVKSAGETDGFYNFFANPKLALYLTVVVFIISIIVAALIYYKLSVKSFDANIESEFASSVMSISQNIDGEQRISEAPKIVSSVIAKDIKKNNKIKDKQNKKDKNNS